MLNAFEYNDTGCKDDDNNDEKLSGWQTCVHSHDQSFSFLITTPDRALPHLKRLSSPVLTHVPTFFPSLRKAQFSALDLYPNKQLGLL